MPRNSHVRKVYDQSHVGFAPFALAALSVISLMKDPYPTRVHALVNATRRFGLPFDLASFLGHMPFVECSHDTTFYGIVTSGCVGVFGPNNGYVCSAGQYFCIPLRANAERQSIFVDASYGEVLLIERIGYYGYPQSGGPLEEAGRLKYIDGCSDTLLICPPVVGEPCLNHLHIPAGTNQTAHTHPSQRIGTIARGSGFCLTPYEGQVLLPEQTVVQWIDPWPVEVSFDATSETAPVSVQTSLKVKTPLRAGMGWWIPTALLHSFHTEGDSLDVVAWHPDSDFGPTHDNHPMVNRTYVNDVASSQIVGIRTTEISA